MGQHRMRLYCSRLQARLQKFEPFARTYEELGVFSYGPKFHSTGIVRKLGIMRKNSSVGSDSESPVPYLYGTNKCVLDLSTSTHCWFQLRNFQQWNSSFFYSKPHISFLRCSINWRDVQLDLTWACSMLEAIIINETCKTTSSYMQVLVLQRDSLAMGNIFRKLNHDSVIIGCGNIYRSVHLLSNGYFNMEEDSIPKFKRGETCKDPIREPKMKT